MSPKKRKALIITLVTIAIIGIFTTFYFITFQTSLTERYADTWVYKGTINTTEFTSFYMETLLKGAEEIEFTPHENETITFRVEFPRGTEFPHGEYHTQGIELWFGITTAAAVVLLALIVLLLGLLAWKKLV